MKETKFKQTEIGMIPDDWEVKRLEPDLGIVKSGKRLPKGYFVQDMVSDHPYIRVIDMEMGHLNTSDIKYVPNEIAHYISKYKISSEDLYISVAGTLGLVGKIPPYLDGANLTENANKITNIKCNQDFLLYWLMSDKQQEIISASQTLGAQPKLALYQIRNFQIPLPPTLSEQQKIAKALSDVDNVISTLEKLITKKKNLKQGTMQLLLTGKKRLPGFAPAVVEPVETPAFKQTEIGEIPEDWELVKLNQLIKDISDGPFGSNLKTEHYTTDREARIIQLGNVGEDGWLDDNVKYTTFIHAKELSRCIVPSGTVIIAKMMPAGRSIICPNNEQMYILGSDCVKFIPNELIDSKYFVYFTKSSYYLKQIIENTQGSTRARTSVSKLRKIEIVLPKKEEQIAIANVLSSMDKEIEELSIKLEKYQNLKIGMMQQLLTGKIRLL